MNFFADSNTEELFEGILVGKYGSIHKGVNAKDILYLSSFSFLVVFTLWPSEIMNGK